MKTLAIELKASSQLERVQTILEDCEESGVSILQIMSASYQLFPDFLSNVNDRKPNTLSMGAVLDQG
jgi:hypothetical protein